MALTKVSPSLFQVSNNITSVTVGGSANTISLTFDSNGVITGASNNAVSVANTAITGNIISSQITSVANTQLTGLIQAAQIGSANATLVTSGTLPEARLPAGSVLQVVQTVKSDTFSVTTSSTFQDITGMSVSITPKFSTSKILVFADIAGNGTAQSATARLVRGSTAIFTGDAAGSRPLGSANWVDNVQFEVQVCTIVFLDSPATTSSTTYKLQIAGSSAAWYLNRSATDRDTSGFDPRLTSSITVMEIAA